MRFPERLLNADGNPKHGTPEMAEFLRSLWTPDDFPCRTMRLDMRDGVPYCVVCGVQMLQVGCSTMHPNTPVARFALKHPELFE